MDEQTVDIRDIYTILLRNFWLIAVVMVLSVGISIALVIYLPKQYKSKGVISINSSYFNNPLTSDMTGTLYDSNELRSQRLSYLQEVLTPEFIDELGDKFDEFTKGAPEIVHAREREELREKIELFPVNNNASQISVKAKDRFEAYGMTKMIMDEMQKALIDRRNDTLMAARKSALKTINTLKKRIAGAETPSSSVRIEKAKIELEKANDQLEMALSSYSELHPNVKKIRLKVKTLQARYDKLVKDNKDQVVSPSVDETDDSITTDPKTLKSNNESLDDFLKKLNRIDFLLDIEKNKDTIEFLSITEKPEVPSSPIFPNSKLFVMCGIVAGMVLSGVLVMFLELKRGTFVSSYYVMDQLDMPMLGELPFDKNMQQELLLLETIEKRSQKLLTDKTKRK